MRVNMGTSVEIPSESIMGHNMNCEWVKTELRNARQTELRLPKSSEISEVFSRQ